jgi:exodeoxyribonuclease VII small subunit
MSQLPAQSSPPTEQPPTFETLVSSLEAVVGRLERGDLPLEAALADYERGVTLARDASAVLSRAELRLAQLTADGAEVPLEAAPRAR